jgi:plastocyanin
MIRLAAGAASLVVVLAVALAVRGGAESDVSPPAAAPVSLLPSCPTKPIAEPYVVDISGFAYCPANLPVTAGAEVAWTNADFAPHTVTFDGPGGQVDSGSMAQGQRWATRFRQPGTYEYYCRLHPGMAGTIVVGARS